MSVAISTVPVSQNGACLSIPPESKRVQSVMDLGW
jgi:hypothetical protein